MAAGEYVSVSSQSDTEQADLGRERKELSQNVAFEEEELAQIYVQRGSRDQSRAAGGTAAHGQGCPRRACTRRTRYFGNHHGATYSGCLHLRCHFLSWCSAAAADGPYHPDALLGGCRLGCIAVVSFTSRSDRCTSRGRRCYQSDSACDVLGCFRHGLDGWRWSVIRYSGLNAQNAGLSLMCLQSLVKPGIGFGPDRIMVLGVSLPPVQLCRKLLTSCRCSSPIKPGALSQASICS